jgi:RNA polymerase sigma-70 factor (ECF subfamily)
VLRAFDKLDTLRDETRFRSWFFAVLLSIHRSRCRRSFWKRFLPLDEGADPPDPVRGGEDDELLGARRAARALAVLPPEQREAVVLFEIEGFSVQEVAEMQGVTVSAVKSRVSRGRKKLAGWYRRHGFRPRRDAPSPRGEEAASEGSLLAFVPSSVPSQSGGRHG